MSKLEVTDRMVDAAIEAWMAVPNGSTRLDALKAAIEAALREQQAEPVGHLHSNGDFCQTKAVPTDSWPVPLYANPPQDKLREAAQMALDFISVSNKSSQFWLVPESNLNKTVDALRAALGEKDE